MTHYDKVVRRLKQIKNELLAASDKGDGELYAQLTLEHGELEGAYADMCSQMEEQADCDETDR